MSDETEALRIAEKNRINECFMSFLKEWATKNGKTENDNISMEELNKITREYYEGVYGKDNVFSTEEIREKYDVLGFLAPFVVVKEKASGLKGSLEFLHSPRFYFNFNYDNPMLVLFGLKNKAQIDQFADKLAKKSEQMAKDFKEALKVEKE